MDWNPFIERASVEEPEPWPVPDRTVMQQRWAHRQAVVRETMEHRRIHTKASVGRNIVDVLYDRERYGSHHKTPLHHRRRKAATKRTTSPATVFDSPVSTTAASNLYSPNQNSAEMELASPSNNHMMNDDMDTSVNNIDVSADLSVSSELASFFPQSISREILRHSEHVAALHSASAFLSHLGGDDVLDDEGRRPTSSRAVSTISVAFSHDGKTMASTHGDHSVKITCCHTGRLLSSLEGHPRTPWTVKYHPSDSNIVASGCLGYQVRVWHWPTNQCLQMVRLEFAIISLSFHPEGNLLAIANGTRLHFWGVNDYVEKPNRTPSGSSTPTPEDPSATTTPRVDRSVFLTEIDQRHMLRCVHFPPNGNTLIIGGVNQTEDMRRRTRGEAGNMSFYLRLWDFDLNVALGRTSSYGMSMPRRPINNPRTFVPRALLYNDGGFDVSPDGKTLCACAEYWLPEGVDNAMELLHREQNSYQAELLEEERARNPELRTRRFSDRISTSSPLPGGPETPIQTPTPDRASEVPPPPRLSDSLLRTPDNPENIVRRLSPPSPPGQRYSNALRQNRPVVSTSGSQQLPDSTRGVDSMTTPPPPPPPTQPPAPGGPGSRPIHPLSLVTGNPQNPDISFQKGRYVPHVVTISLETNPIPPEANRKMPRGKSYGAVAIGHRPRLGQLIEACPLDGAKASAVTCVKFSPSTDYCLIGYGVREPVSEGGGRLHPVTALYRITGGMVPVSTMLSGDDDVNIARFHPDPGHGYVYGTKQGRVRILSPRTWMYYNS